MHEVSVNLWAVLAAGIVNMIVGAIWYMPSVFGTMWMKELGMKKDDAMAANMGQAYGITFVGALVMSYVLAMVIGFSGANLVMDGVIVALWLWLGFAVVLPLNDVVFGKKSWTLYFINVAYYAVVMVINGAIFAVYR